MRVCVCACVRVCVCVYVCVCTCMHAWVYLHADMYTEGKGLTNLVCPIYMHSLTSISVLYRSELHTINTCGITLVGGVRCVFQSFGHLIQPA